MTSPATHLTAASHTGAAPAAIILGAGKGTRMKSDLPKVCHPIGGAPMIRAVVDACLAAGCGRIVAIVGYKQEVVRDALASYGSVVQFAVQEEQLGTGHAVRSAKDLFTGLLPGQLDTFVLCGDGPLIRPSTLEMLLSRHRESKARATLATAVLADSTGYGRIVRDGAGRFKAIVEQKNATPAELAIKEVNPSYYCFDAASLFSALERVTRNALTGEYYLTDVPGLLSQEGHRVEIVQAVPPEDVLSINTLEELDNVDRIFRGRANSNSSAGRGSHPSPSHQASSR
jgi:bifunctional UDP-N-acetylglucosamine pyrophosphorylase/glucosamine-1-phosphate N-acetyltransferase